ncbi:50S ribosomal protein L21 [Candidatus Peregrinibacteria bacterium CG11_big_fil_rev_8_21_14_0_20_46_8]|nr:MAG: 50S ribosomal protein L21 [Candidatus Peregrinibacteria bacterium CG11_big_fil_rev_8_21_14_0_20_46_8]
MFAIVEIGGKQYKVQEKDRIVVEKLTLDEGKSYNDAKILLVSDGKDTMVGAPYVSGAKVECKVLKQGKGEKLRVYKMVAKKRERKLRGHRQELTELEVTKVAAK